MPDRPPWRGPTRCWRAVAERFARLDPVLAAEVVMLLLTLLALLAVPAACFNSG